MLRPSTAAGKAHTLTNGSAPSGDECACRGALDARPVRLVRGIVRTHRGKARSQILQLGLGATLVDLLRADRLLYEHRHAIVAHFGVTFSHRVPVLAAPGHVDQLARRDGCDQLRVSWTGGEAAFHGPAPGS